MQPLPASLYTARINNRVFKYFADNKRSEWHQCFSEIFSSKHRPTRNIKYASLTVFLNLEP